MMAHGAMLWGAALYNNGGYPIKDTNFGESYNQRRGTGKTILRFFCKTAQNNV